MSEVFVLGHRGMLGHVVTRYLRERGHAVRTSDARYVPAEHAPLIEEVRDSGCPFVINALGVIKQKSGDWGALVAANGVLPVHLRARLRPEQRLVHASSDCVFSGTRGAYRVTDPVDATDAYGLSKILGERIATMPGALVLRASTIGPEVNSAFGFMGWVLAQRGRARGYVDHEWNGITTLEWASLVESIVRRERPWGDGLIQLMSHEPISKWALADAIRERWQVPVEFERHATEARVDRTLVGEARGTIESQLDALRAWTSTL